MKKGNLSIEFIFAVTLFLAMFWVTFNQVSESISIKSERIDLKQQGAEAMSNHFMHSPGEPVNWTFSTATDMAFATYLSNVTQANTLNATKLDEIDGESCSEIRSPYFNGLNFRMKVETDHEEWECNAVHEPSVPSINRQVYVYKNSEYYAGVLTLWVW